MFAAFTEIFSITAPAFILIAAGHILRRIHRLSADAASGVTQIVFYIAVPSLLFRSIARSDFSTAFPESAVITVYLITIITAAAAYAAAALFSRTDAGVFSQGVYRSNMVFLGLPVITYTFGPDSPVMATVAILIGMIVPLYNLLAVAVLSLSAARQASRSLRMKGILQDILLNPLILSSGAGIIWSLGGLPLPVFMNRSLEMAGEIAAPLALISVGISLDFRYLQSKMMITMIVTLLKLFVYPAAVFSALLLQNQDSRLIVSAVILTASPTAVVSFIMAREMGGDENLSAAIVVATTVFSLISLSAWLAFFRIYGII